MKDLRRFHESINDSLVALRSQSKPPRQSTRRLRVRQHPHRFATALQLGIEDQFEIKSVSETLGTSLKLHYLQRQRLVELRHPQNFMTLDSQFLQDVAECVEVPSLEILEDNLL